LKNNYPTLYFSGLDFYISFFFGILLKSFSTDKISMQSKKYKYQDSLDLFPNCPPNSYRNIEIECFRWVFKNNISDSFIPMNLIKEPPPRMLDDSDLICKGYGLSLFDTFENGRSRYENLYKRKRGISHEDFINEKGNSIAMLEMNGSEGVYGDLNTENGHFTLHEYEGTDLSSKIVNITEIFDENGNFKR
jgi:hypothetical protein